MKPGAHIVLASTARFYAPLIVLLALSMLAARAPGGGVGFIAGLGFVLALILHALVFGAAASGSAFPPWIARLVLSLGLAAALVGAAAPGLAYAPQVAEAGLCAVTAAGGALIMAVLIGRAPTLRDEDW